MKKPITIINEMKPKPSIKNLILAFVCGAIIAIIGEGISYIYQNFFSFNKTDASSLTIITIIGITCLLTGLGVYDKLARYFGAGLFIPITGFANSMCSSALESKTEGLVYGIGSNMFKLSGSVIVYGIVTTFIVGVIRYVFKY